MLQRRASSRQAAVLQHRPKNPRRCRAIGLCSFVGGDNLLLMSTLVIGVRRAEARDAEGITEVHDAAWRNAYDGMIPAKELNRIIARRGPALVGQGHSPGDGDPGAGGRRRGVRLRHLRAEPGAQSRPEGRDLRDLHQAGISGHWPGHAPVPGGAARARPFRLRFGGGVGAGRQRQCLPLLPQCRRTQGRARQRAFRRFGADQGRLRLGPRRRRQHD